jgi:OOP family OmpA-OmpF porin
MHKHGMRILLMLIAAMSAHAASPLVPEQRGYVGASAGRADFRRACEGVTVSCDDNDTAARLFVGYQFGRTGALELGYADLGKARASGTVSGAAASAEGKVTAWDAVAVALHPVSERFSLMGKLGFYRAETKVSGSASIAGFSATAADADRNTGLTFGLGGMYDFTRHLAARAEWQRYHRVGGDNTGGRQNIDFFSVGALVKF